MKLSPYFSLAAVLLFVGCDPVKNASGTGENKQPETPKRSPTEEQAIVIAKKLFAEHWLQDGDSWFSKISAESGWEGVLRQIKGDLKLSVDELSEADRLNGLQWKGSVYLEARVARTYSQEQKKWGDWGQTGILPGVTLILQNGTWRVENDTYWWNLHKKPTLQSLPPLSVFEPVDKGSTATKSGTAFFIRLQPAEDPITGEKLQLTQQSLEQAVHVIRNRFGNMGTDASVITPPGVERVIVHIPNVTVEKLDDIRWKLQQVGNLDFRTVHPESSSILPAIEARQKILDPAWTILPFGKKDKDTKSIERSLVVHRVPDITGEHIKSAVAEHDAEGWFISIQFDKAASDKFLDFTSKMRTNQDRFAIVLDHRILSVSTIQKNGGITDGHCKITGSFTEHEARTLEKVLLNPLKNSVKIEEEQFIDLVALKRTTGQGQLGQK